MGFSIKRILVLCILLSSGFHLNAEDGRLLGAICVDQAPLFLVGNGDSLQLQRRDGTILDRIPECVVVDIGDESQWLTIESTADRTTLNLRDGMEVVTSINLDDPVPLIQLMKTCNRIAMVSGPLVLIPERTPVLWNRESGTKRPVHSFYRYDGGGLVLEDLSDVRLLNDLVFVNNGESIEAMRLSTLESLGTTWTDETLLEAAMSGGAVLLRLTGGERLAWNSEQTRFRKLERIESDRDALVFRWEAAPGRPMDVRLALDDMGLFDALSAWKSGQLEAELVVRSGENRLLEKRLVFSVKDVGNFMFRVVRRDGAVLIRFREKTEVLVFHDGQPEIISVDSRLNPVVYEGRVYIMENGIIRESSRR